MKKFFRILLTIFLVLIIVIGIGFFVGRDWYNKQLTTPNSSSDESVRFEIAPGDSADVIAADLKEKNLIKNADVFYWYVRINNLSPKIQAGTFILERNMTIIEIAEAIQKASEDTVWVTVPEGLRMDEIGDIYEDEFKNLEGIEFSREEFDAIVASPDAYTFSTAVESFLAKYKPKGKSLEGFLYPDTYNFERKATAKQAIEKMISTLISKVKTEDLTKLQTGSLDFYEILILASLIEREAFADAERPMIADILIKRLEGKMDGVKLLQVDATLLYEAKDWKANAFLLKSKDSPYNTYKYTGLPPTPIANPGIGAIEAAINPTANEYFFYLHDENGRIYYGKNLDEHNANKRKYIDN